MAKGNRVTSPAQGLGADVVIDYHAVRFEEVCSGDPFDAVLDSIGGALPRPPPPRLSPRRPPGCTRAPSPRSAPHPAKLRLPATLLKAEWLHLARLSWR